MSDEAIEAKRITHWAMYQYRITNGDALYREIYAALVAARLRGKPRTNTKRLTGR